MSQSLRSRAKASGQPICSECKRSLPNNRICTFCNANNNTASTVIRGLGHGPADSGVQLLPSAGSTSPSVNHSSLDIVRALSNLETRISELSSGLGSLVARLESVETRLISVEVIAERLDAISSRVVCLEDSVARSGVMDSVVGRLTTAVDDMFAHRDLLMEKISGLENRCAALEGPAAGVDCSNPSSPTVDGLLSRIRDFELSQRDYEIIIFGLPASRGEDRLHLLSSLAASFGLLHTTNDIANLIRLGKNSSSSRPLVVRFVSVAKRNEWLAASRHKRGITARDIDISWPSDRVAIYERSTAAERRALVEVKSLAARHNVKHVWMRRGIIYFKTSVNSRPQRFISSESFIQAISPTLSDLPLSRLPTACSLSANIVSNSGTSL